MSTVTDGRVLRGARTRSRIVQALLDLLNEGVLSPTSNQIAERAQVSVRSVFQHFTDMEALYADLAAEQRERVTPLLTALTRPESLDDRIDALVAQRSELFETIAPVRHAIGTRAFESRALQARLTELSAALRSQVAEQFEPELRAMPAAQRRRTVEALDMVCSFEAWDRLRVAQGVARRDAEQVLRATVAALLS